MRVDRLALAGPLSVAIAFLSIAAAIGAAPSFSFTADALSDLGVRAGSAPLFNGGLVLAGIVGLGFAAWLFRSAASLLQRVGAGLVSLALLGLSVVGLFPLTHSAYAPAAITFYL